MSEWSEVVRKNTLSEAGFSMCKWIVCHGNVDENKMYYVDKKIQGL